VNTRGEPTEPAAADPLDALFSQALALHRAGDITRAEHVYTRILAERPEHAGSLHLLGAIAMQQGRLELACALIARSIRANPRHAVAHADLAGAQQGLGLSAEAIASYDRALRLAPDLLAALFNKAILLQEVGRLAEALAGYERVLKLQPTLVPALYNRAVLLTALGRRHEAMRAYERCLQVAPDHGEALSNHGALLMDLGRPADALRSLDKALAASPRLAKALNNRGNALRSLNRLEEARADYDKALAVEPNFFEALRNRGTVLRALNLPGPALQSLDRASSLRPQDPDVLLARAEALIELQRYGEAKDCLGALLDAAPDLPYVRGLRLHVQGLACDWNGYAEHVRSLLHGSSAGAEADYPFPFLAVTDDPAAQARCARHFVAAKFPAAPTAAPASRTKSRRHRKIRLAYVSGDLRLHPVSALLAGVLEKHDRARFETIAISLRPIEQTPLGLRVMASFDEFIDVSRMSDQGVVAWMEQREIDIAIDLMGFTLGSRPAILARRAAPIQVNYLGYPGTMGAGYIDYILADEFVIPDPLRSHYAEKVVWLPDSFQANDHLRPRSMERPSRRQLDLPDFGFVFCCFNNTYKLNPACFDVWMRLLTAMPYSVLWLFADEPDAQYNLAREAERRGVEPRRLIFANRIPYADHLARLPCADLFLDTLPFNAGTTASDALWAGVPVLTCAGRAFAARMGGSLLRAVGLPQLITSDVAEYEALALKLATTPALLADMRKHLTDNRADLPLFDTERTCRHIESAYESMWRLHASGKKPESFAVPCLPRVAS
jgi:predicted O-linked N-acetylglucosamine transferase (SPINDLY family)